MHSTAPRTVSYWWILPILILALCAAYSNHFQNSFHFDDFHTVTDNPNIRSLANIPRFFTDARTFSVLPANCSWRPLVSTSLAVDYWMGKGLQPIAFHASTFLLYLVQIVVLFFLCELVFEYARPGGPNRIAAFFAAGLYGLHPACAETVNYVIQRGDLYSTLGVVAGLYLYIRFPNRRRYGFYLLAVAAGALSKPTTLIFPLLLFVYVRLFEEENAARAAAPSLLVCALLGVLHARLTPATYVAGADSASAYRITQPYVALRYFGSFFLPVRLSADTDLRPLSGIGSPEALAGWLFLAAVLAAALLCSRRRTWKPIGFGLWWFLIALAPTSLFPLAELENDHRMFFPFVGLAMSVAWAVALAGRRLLQRVPAAVPVSLAAVALTLYGCGTWQRNRIWRSEESLWRDVATKSPANGRGLMNYGLTLMAKGDMESALGYFERALKYRSEYPVLEINLGVANGALRRDVDAERHFQRALALAPADAQPYFYYARWLDERGRTAEALIRARAAVALNPAQPGAQALLAKLQSASTPDPVGQAERTAAANPSAGNELDLSWRYYQAGRFAESIRAARDALRRKPGYAEAYNNIAVGYLGLGELDEALRNALEAVRLAPDNQLAKNNLAWIRQERQKALAPSQVAADSYLNLSLQLCRSGKNRECIAAATEALRLKPDMAAAYNNIAVGYLGLGMPDEAIAAAETAIRLQPDFQIAKNNLAWARDEKRKREKRPGAKPPY